MGYSLNLNSVKFHLVRNKFLLISQFISNLAYYSYLYSAYTYLYVHLHCNTNNFCFDELPFS